MIFPILLVVAGVAALTAAIIVPDRALEAGARTGDEPAPVVFPEPPPPSPLEHSEYSDADMAALASALRSEAGSQHDDERQAIAFAIRNYVRRVKRPISAVAPIGQGQGGKQPWATSKAAQASDHDDAMKFLSLPWSQDLTHGAHMFFEPAAQDKILRLADMYRSNPGKYSKYANLAKYKRSADEIRRKWTSEGNQLLATVGRWEFYGRPRSLVLGYAPVFTDIPDPLDVLQPTRR